MAATGGVCILAAVAGVAGILIDAAVAALVGGSNVPVASVDAGIKDESGFLDAGTDVDVADSIAACAELCFATCDWSSCMTPNPDFCPGGCDTAAAAAAAGEGAGIAVQTNFGSGGSVAVIAAVAAVAADIGVVTTLLVAGCAVTATTATGVHEFVMGAVHGA